MCSLFCSFLCSQDFCTLRERETNVFALLWNDDDGDGDDDEFVVVVVVFPRGSIVENDANEFPPPL